jgi:hypothetical protein
VAGQLHTFDKAVGRQMCRHRCILSRS